MAKKDNQPTTKKGPAIPEEPGVPQVPAGGSDAEVKAKADAEAAAAKAEAEAKAKADAEAAAAADKPKQVRVICEGTLGSRLLVKGDVTSKEEYVRILNRKGQKLVELVK